MMHKYFHNLHDINMDWKIIRDVCIEDTGRTMQGTSGKLKQVTNEDEAVIFGSDSINVLHITLRSNRVSRPQNMGFPQVVKNNLQKS